MVGDGGASSGHGRYRLQVEGRPRLDRTPNMLLMSVTLDVSKLSGWLNAYAYCRVEREACGKRGGGGMRGRATATAEVVLWQGQRAERTLNMPYMFSTLEVSQLSGWLNASAPCRVETGAWEEGRHAGPGDGRGRGAAAAAQAACAGRTPNCGGCAVARATRGAHHKHEVHVFDAGSVPARNVSVKRCYARSVVYELQQVRHGGHVPRPNRPIHRICLIRVAAEDSERGCELVFGRKHRGWGNTAWRGTDEDAKRASGNPVCRCAIERRC